MFVDARLETKDLLPQAKGFNLSSVHIKSHEHTTKRSISYSFYIYMLAARVSHIPSGKLGGVTPQGGVLPKGICYKGLPRYFSVFPFCWWNIAHIIWWFHLPRWRFGITFHGSFLPALFNATLKRQIKNQRNNLFFHRSHTHSRSLIGYNLLLIRS